MNHLKLYEDFRILEEIPKWFYLVFNFQGRAPGKEGYKAIINMKFENILGISDNPEVINKFMYMRNSLLVMNGESFLKLNPYVYKIDYTNHNSLVSNNFFILNRLLQNPEDKPYYYNVVQKIFSTAMEIKNFKQKELHVAKFLHDNQYNITDIVEKYIEKENGKINNVLELTNLIYKNLPQLIINYNKDYPWGTPYDIKNFDRESVYNVTYRGIVELCKVWKNEGEWIIKKDKITGIRSFEIPLHSKLYFNISMTDEKEIENFHKEKPYLSHKGLSEEEYKFILETIKKNNLEDKYEINFVEGFPNIYKEFKDVSAPKMKKIKRLKPILK